MADPQARTLPMPELLELARHARLGAGPGAGVTVDFEAMHDLDQPLIVVRVPAEPAARPATSSPLDRLTPRELAVARLVADGLANKQIAARLGVTTGTIKDHIHNALEKTGLPNRAAVAAAVANAR